MYNYLLFLIVLFAIISGGHGQISLEDINRLWNFSYSSPLADSFKTDFVSNSIF